MVKIKLKSASFDISKVTRSVDTATLGWLKKAGAFVRRTARSLLRQRKAVSAPGSPPSSHTGALRGLIRFDADIKRRSVLIGPTRARSGEAPKLLEYGGDAVRDGKKAHYRARPFMGPAEKKERPKLTGMWAGAIKGK